MLILVKVITMSSARAKRARPHWSLNLKLSITILTGKAKEVVFMVKQNGDRPHPVIAEFNADVFLAEIDEPVLRTVMNGYATVKIRPEPDMADAFRLTIGNKESVFSGAPEEACRIIAAFFLKAAMTIPRIRETDRFNAKREETADDEIDPDAAMYGEEY